MTGSEFKKYAAFGLGRCVIALGDAAEREKHRDELLGLCLKSRAYDLQSEGTRSAYLYDMICRYDDREYFLTPVLQRFSELPDRRGDDFAQLCDLVELFADGGENRAKAALLNKYEELCRKLRSKKRIGYDFARDNYERVCIALLSLNESLPIYISEDMGTLFSKGKYDGEDFGWFLFVACDKFGEKEILKTLKENDGNNIRAFRDEFMRARKKERSARKRTKRKTPSAEDMLKNESPDPVSPYLFARRAPLSQQKTVADAMVEETDTERKIELLDIFSFCGIPSRQEEVVGYARSENERLREVACEVLEKSRGRVVREFALELLEKDRGSALGARILIRNYRESDLELLTDIFEKIKKDEDEDEAHGVGFAVLDALKRGVKLPVQAAEFVYYSRCSRCRKSAVSIMAEKGWLKEPLISECAFDCNLDIRRLIKERYSAKLSEK